MPQPGNGIPNGLGKETKEKTERGRIWELLERHGRHTEGKKAAGGLGISLATLYRRVGQLGLLPGKRGMMRDQHADVRRTRSRTRGSGVDPGLAKEPGRRRALPVSGAACRGCDPPESENAACAMLRGGLGKLRPARRNEMRPPRRSCKGGDGSPPFFHGDALRPFPGGGGPTVCSDP